MNFEHQLKSYFVDVTSALELWFRPPPPPPQKKKKKKEKVGGGGGKVVENCKHPQGGIPQIMNAKMVITQVKLIII